MPKPKVMYGIEEPDGSIEMWDKEEHAREVWDECEPQPPSGSRLVRIETTIIPLTRRKK